MQHQKLQLENIRYNPEQSAYEARARVYDNGDVFDYPVHVCAPLNAEFSHVTRSLSQKARDAHSAPQGTLRLRRARTIRVKPRPATRTTVADRFIQQIRAALAA